MVEIARREFGIGWVDFLPDAKLRGRTAEFIREKYSQETYNHKR
jgi:hypothetical protein